MSMTSRCRRDRRWGNWLDGSGCELHVEVSDPVAGLRVIREVLRRLNAPASTRIVGDAGELCLDSG